LRTNTIGPQPSHKGEGHTVTLAAVGYDGKLGVSKKIVKFKVNILLEGNLIVFLIKIFPTKIIF
jgi:hypothetical protein